MRSICSGWPAQPSRDQAVGVARTHSSVCTRPKEEVDKPVSVIPEDSLASCCFLLKREKTKEMPAFEKTSGLCRRSLSQTVLFSPKCVTSTFSYGSPSSHLLRGDGGSPVPTMLLPKVEITEEGTRRKRRPCVMHGDGTGSVVLAAKSGPREEDVTAGSGRGTDGGVAKLFSPSARRRPRDDDDDDDDAPPPPPPFSRGELGGERKLPLHFDSFAKERPVVPPRADTSDGREPDRRNEARGENPEELGTQTESFDSFLNWISLRSRKRKESEHLTEKYVSVKVDHIYQVLLSLTHEVGQLSFDDTMNQFWHSLYFTHTPQVVRKKDAHFSNFVFLKQLHLKERCESSRLNHEHRDAKFYKFNLKNKQLLFKHWKSKCGTQGRPGSPDSAYGNVDDDGDGGFLSGKYKSSSQDISDGRKESNKEVSLITTPSDPASGGGKGRRKKHLISRSRSANVGCDGDLCAASKNGTDKSSIGSQQKKQRCIQKKERKKLAIKNRKNPPENEQEQVTLLYNDENEAIAESNSEIDGQPVPDVQIPNLPSFNPSTPKGLEQQQRLHERQAMFHLLNMNKCNANEPEKDGKQTKEDSEISAPECRHEESGAKKAKVQPWLQGQLALSMQSCRFELPMDITLLEGMSPSEYLRQYCVVSSRRQLLYQKVFNRNKDKNGMIPVMDLEKCLEAALVSNIPKDQMDTIHELLELKDDESVDFQLFAGIAAFGERMLCQKSENTNSQSQELQREEIERADFSSLHWKFHGVLVNPKIKKILQILTSDNTVNSSKWTL